MCHLIGVCFVTIVLRLYRHRTPRQRVAASMDRRSILNERARRIAVVRSWSFRG